MSGFLCCGYCPPLPRLSSNNRWYFSKQPAMGSWLMGNSSWISPLHLAQSHLLHTANKNLFNVHYLQRDRVTSLCVLEEGTWGGKSVCCHNSWYFLTPTSSQTWGKRMHLRSLCPSFASPLPCFVSSLSLTQLFHYLHHLIRFAFH